MSVTQEIFNAVLPAITSQINVRLVVGVVAGVFGAIIGLVFLLWAIEYLSIVFMNAFRHGDLSSKKNNSDEWNSYDLYEQDRLDFVRDLRESLGK